VIFPPESSSPVSSSPRDPHSNPNGTHGVSQREKEKVLLGTDRYSIAYFCHPTDTTPLEAVPSKLIPVLRSHDGGGAGQEGEVRAGELRVGYGGGADDGSGSRSGSGRREKVLTAKEHLVRRLEATYGFVHA